MKPSYLLIAGILPLFAYSANASHFYANSISMHSISAIQDSILHTSMHTFDRVPAANLAEKAKTMPVMSEYDLSKMYGKLPMYGTTPIYGEYEEYEFAGRSGGDNGDWPALKNIQFTWQHFKDRAKLENFGRINSRYDIAMIGITGGRSDFIQGVSGLAAYAGFIDGNQSTRALQIDQKGGYAGVYARFTSKYINLATTLNGGIITNDAEFNLGIDNYSNKWLGAATKASTNIVLDSTFALQPGVQIGYTWIASDSYDSISNDQLSNSDMGIFEITPALYAIKHINNGWFGNAHVRYIATIINGGDLAVNGQNFSTLQSENYTEYGLSLEKTVGRLNLHGTIVRRDGGRDGWGGNLNIKYIF